MTMNPKFIRLLVQNIVISCQGTKPIMSIWSFKCKQYPDGTLNKHKARLCAHGGMQTWGENYWEMYASVVNWARSLDMKWCKLCGPGRTKGTLIGMYMQALQDQQNGFSPKKEKQAKFDAKKKSLKANKSKASDDTNSTNNNAKHLKLSDSIVNGLTTEIMLGDSKACIIARQSLKNANKGFSNLADTLVKD
jgi:hypothetical protein